MAGVVGLFGAEQRHPAGNAHALVTADRDVRETALAGIRTVQSGNAELVAVIGAIIRSLYGLFHSLIAEDSIEEQGRRKRVRVSDGAIVDLGIAETGIGTWSRAAGHSEDPGAAHKCRHVAILAPDRVLVAAIPIDLGVDIVAVEFRHSRGEVIVTLAGLIRVREVCLNLGRRKAEPARVDLVTRKRSAAAAIGIAGRRVVDDCAVLTEIAGLDIRGRHGGGIHTALPLARAIPAEEEEQLVLQDGPA